MSGKDTGRPTYEVFASASGEDKPAPKYEGFVSAGQTLDGVGKLEDGVGEDNGGVPVDSRPLSEIIRDQREKKQEEWEKAHNPFQPPKAMDEDEVKFLEETEMSVREREIAEAEAMKKRLEHFRTVRDSYVYRKATDQPLAGRTGTSEQERIREGTFGSVSSRDAESTTTPSKPGLRSLKIVKVIVKEKKASVSPLPSTSALQGKDATSKTSTPSVLLPGVGNYGSDDGEVEEDDETDDASGDQKCVDTNG